MGVGVLLAIRDAVTEARKEAGIDPKTWFRLGEKPRETLVLWERED